MQTKTFVLSLHIKSFLLLTALVTFTLSVIRRPIVMRFISLEIEYKHILI